MQTLDTQGLKGCFSVGSSPTIGTRKKSLESQRFKGFLLGIKGIQPQANSQYIVSHYQYFGKNTSKITNEITNAESTGVE